MLFRSTRDEPTGAIPNFFQSGALTTAESVRRTGVSGTLDLTKPTKSAEKFGTGLDNSMTKIFALQFALSGLTNTLDDQDGKYATLGKELSSLVNTIMILQVTGFSPRIPGLGKGKGTMGRAFTAGRAGKNLASAGGLARLAVGAGRLVSVFGRFVPYLGLAIIAFQALNSVAKHFFGKSLFQALGEGLGIAASESEKFADRVNEATKNLDRGALRKDISKINEELGPLQAQAVKIKDDFDLKFNSKRQAELEKMYGPVSDFKGTLAPPSSSPFNPRRTNNPVGRTSLLDLSTVSTNFLEPEELKELQQRIDKLISQREVLQEALEGVGAKIQVDAKADREKTISALEAVKELQLSVQQQRQGIEDRFSGLTANIGPNGFERTGFIERPGFPQSGMSSLSQAGIDIAKAKGGSREEMRDLDFSEKRLKLEKEYALSKNESIGKIVEAAITVGDLNEKEEEIVNTIKEQIKAGASFKKIQEKLKGTAGENLNAFLQQVDTQDLGLTLLDDAYQKDLLRLKANKKLADSIAKQGEGLRGFVNKTNAELKNLSTDVPARLAENLKGSLENTFNELAEGS